MLELERVSAGPLRLRVEEADVNLFKMERHPGCPGTLLVPPRNNAGLSPV